MDLRELVKNSIIRLQIDTKNLFKLVGTGFELDWSGLDMFKLVLTGWIKKSHGEIQLLIQEYQKENVFYSELVHCKNEFSEHECMIEEVTI